jgi:hypothetical protein
MNGERWTDSAGAAFDALAQQTSVREVFAQQEDSSDDNSDPLLELVGNGHHKVPRGVFNKKQYGFSDEALDAFENATTGHFNDPSSNLFDSLHRDYNAAVEEQLDRFLGRNKVTPSEMTKDQAETFVKEVERSSDPRIRKFNHRMMMREILYWYRRAPRGRE